LPRSTRETGEAERLNPVEAGTYDRTIVGRLKRLLRAPAIDPKIVELHRSGISWKREWYARGERVTVDAAPFLGG
jgi:hypothetical protein